MQSFWAMGGYGFYIWMAYGSVLSVMGWGFILSFLRLKKIKKQLKQHVSTS